MYRDYRRTFEHATLESLEVGVIPDSVLLIEEQTSFQYRNVNKKTTRRLSQRSVHYPNISISFQDTLRTGLLYYTQGDVNG
jgi:hypothetical protein